ncbi:MAG: BON domain-containing protein [Patescibacteria group bacterium]|jgi:hypothetical protein
MFPYGYGYYGGPYYGGYGPYGGPGMGAGAGPGFGPGVGAPYGVTDYTDFYDYNSNLVLEDNEIQDLVSDTIAADPYIPQSDVNAINVSVNNGVVHLSGTVRNRRSKPLAYADAFWSRGVVDVVSDIVVREPGRAEGGQPGGGQMNGGRQGGGTQGARGGGRSY